MTYFNIDTKNVKNQTSSLGRVAALLAGCSKKVDGVISTLSAVGLSAVVPALEQVHHELNSEKEECEALMEALLKIVMTYINQELGLLEAGSSIQNIMEWIEDIINGEDNSDTTDDSDVVPFEIDSILYDDIGSYGGDQGAANDLQGDDRDALYQIIANNVPFIDINDTARIEAVLARAEEEGCGYMALTNSIFSYFENDPERFEKTFGYPMYNEDGDLNYNMLFIDLYSSVDYTSPYTGEIDDSLYDLNFDPREDFTFYENGELASNHYDPRTDATGNGTNVNDREAYINAFMEQHGIEVNYDKDVDVTPGNFQEITEEGNTVIIRYEHGYIFDAEGNKEQIDSHAMVVTGVTEDGRYIVSSWGKEYYIDPNQVYETEDKFGEVGTTSIGFETVNYN